MAVRPPCNIFTATKQELMSLPQIGETRAELIVKCREKEGGVDRDDFMAIRDIPSTVWITLIEKERT